MEVLIIIGVVLLTALAVVVTWLGVPGTFIMAVIALIGGWITDFAVLTTGQVLIMFAVSIVLEVAEFFLSGLAVKYFGAGNRTAIFAIAGGIVGTIIGAGMLFLAGAFFGLLAGSYAGAYLSEILEGRTSTEAARTAFGAVMGNVVSKVLKSTAVIVMGVWLGRVLVV